MILAPAIKKLYFGGDEPLFSTKFLLPFCGVFTSKSPAETIRSPLGCLYMVYASGQK